MNQSTLPIPQAFQIQDDGTKFTITWSWFSLTSIIAIVFSIFWFGFLAFWYFIAFTAFNSQQEGEHAFWGMVLFPLMHVFAGIAIAYTGICGLLNKTDFSIEKQTVSIKHYPLPWRGNCALQQHEVHQLYVKQQARVNKNSVHYIYQLCLLQPNNRERVLHTMYNADEAKFLEHTLEQRLGIQNKNITGEYKS